MLIFVGLPFLFANAFVDFGGIYSTAYPEHGVNMPNVFTGDYSCPSGFSAQCTTIAGAFTKYCFCEQQAFTKGQIYGGMYSELWYHPCVHGCATKNRYTSDCTCPQGYVPTSIASYTQGVDCQDLIFANLTVCVLSGATNHQSNFQGGFEIAHTRSGSSCLFPNFFTGSCSCPEETTQIIPLRDVNGTNGRDYFGGDATVCVQQTRF